MRAKKVDEIKLTMTTREAANIMGAVGEVLGTLDSLPDHMVTVDSRQVLMGLVALLGETL